MGAVRRARRIRIWTATDSGLLASGDPSTMLRLHTAGFLGVALLVLSLFVFTLSFTNRERYVTPKTVAALALPFVVTLVLIGTEHLIGHGLMVSDYRVVSVGSFRLLDVEWGPAFTIHVLYSYGLIGATLLVYAIEFVRVESRTPYRRQLILLVFAIAAPSVATLVYLTQDPLVDPTGLALAFTGIVFYLLIFRFNLLDPVPIARDIAIEELEHGFMVLDTDGQIVDVNRSLAAMSERSPAALVGARVATVYGDHPEFIEMVESETDSNRDFTAQYDDELRHFSVDVSKVYAGNDRFVGRVVLARDVTTDRRREQRLREQTELLRQQNERLDKFASIVSHDLRNPLTVATGFLELEREQRTSRNLEVIDGALDRMDEIIEDVLTISRQTTEAIDAEPIDFESVATAAWTMTGTGDADVRFESSRRLVADRSRLKQLLENLFRNAIEHGGDDATVTVGSLPDGFYVEDDGPGIPADKLEAVFDEGYSTLGSGTGFGLAIVRAIADAHGWSVRATEGSTGGARFEITGADDAPFEA
nr:histidine kinase N-terminal 7TM domain-containing protein [Natronorubrum halophilum]